MIFTHRDDPTRTATIEKISDAPLTYVVHHTNEKGKARKKTFKGGYVHDKALRFVLNKERYIARSPQDSSILWMTKFLSNYTGESQHCVHSNGTIWADGQDGYLYKVERGSCETKKVRFGKATKIVAGPSGEAIVFNLDYQKRKDDGFNLKLTIRSVDLDFQINELTSFVVDATDSILNTISISEKGIFLAPHPDGAGLYKLDGSVQRIFSLNALEPSPGYIAHIASGTISKNGEWIAISDGGSIRRLELKTDTWEHYPAEFTNFGDVQITDSGTVYVTGFQYPSHGFFRVDDQGTEKISSVYRSTISNDGTCYVEVQPGSVTLRSLEIREEENQPGIELFLMKVLKQIETTELGVAKYGKAAFLDNETVVVLTDAYTLAEISFK